MSKVSELTELTTTPATGDYIPVVDVSDTTQAASGTTKRVSVANLHGYGLINVQAYGAIGDGSTDDTDALNNAWDALTSSRGTLLFPQGTYCISDELTWNDKTNVVIIGNGSKISVLTDADMTGKPMIDMSGSSFAKVYDLDIDSQDGSVHPAVGLVLGRTGSNHGSRCTFVGVEISGYFTYASYYNVGSEVDTFINCYFENYYDGAEAAFIGSLDIGSFTGVNAGQIQGTYIGCTFHQFGSSACETIRFHGTVKNHNFYGCYGTILPSGQFVSVTGSLFAYNVFDGLLVEPASGTHTDSLFLALNCTSGMNGCRFDSIQYSAVQSTYMFDFNYAVIESIIGRNCLRHSSTLLMDIADTFSYNEVHGRGAAKITFTGTPTLTENAFIWSDANYPFATGNYINQIIKPTGASEIQLTANSTTPSVGNGTVFQTANTASTTITNFTNGVTGQMIVVRSGDFDTYLNFSGTSLKGASASASVQLRYGDAVVAHNIGGLWFCTIIDGTA